MGWFHLHKLVKTRGDNLVINVADDNRPLNMHDVSLASNDSIHSAMTASCGAWADPKDAQRSLSGERVMVVMDGSNASKEALQWALTHIVQKLHVVTLVNVLPIKTTSSHDHPQRDPGPEDELPKGTTQRHEKASKYILSMKSLCLKRLPEVQVETLIVLGAEKGPTIVNQANKLGVSILILGHRKQRNICRLLGRKTDQHVKYCIQNSDCLTLAVRKKSQRTGGYLIDSKCLKNFWLLA